METLWDRVKKTVLDGAAYAAEKTEELTKLSKMKIEILNIKYKISKSFTELGGLAYDCFKSGKSEEILQSNEIKSIVGNIQKLEKDLDEKEKLFEEMKKVPYPPK